MLNHIKYSSIRLRDVQQRVTIKGPDTSCFSSVKLSLGGNIVTFKAPKHRPPNSSYEQILPVPFNSMDFGCRALNEFDMPDQSWKSQTLFYRAWRFCGPWFTGTLGRVAMSISVYEPSEKSNDSSFFHPRALENNLFNFLNSLYAQNSEANMVEAPVNWKPSEKLPVPGALFHIIPKRKVAGCSQVIIFPISHTHFIEINFRFNRSFGDQLKELDTLISSQPMYDFANQIIDSLNLELSEESQEQFDNIKAEYPDMKLTENFPPINWSVSNSSIAT